MPRKKKEVLEDASVHNEKSENEEKQDRKVPKDNDNEDNLSELPETTSPSEDVYEETQEPQDSGGVDVEPESTEPIIMPISMIYKGKRYVVGQDLTGFNDEVVEALLVKLLTMMGDQAESEEE